MVLGGGDTGGGELNVACRGVPTVCLVLGGGIGGSNALAVFGRYCDTDTAGGGAGGADDTGAGGGGTGTVAGAYVDVCEVDPYE